VNVKQRLDQAFAACIEPNFQRDDQGQELFFPFGLGSRGRIVPDAAAGERMRNSLKMMFIAINLVVVPIAVLAAIMTMTYVLVSHDIQQSNAVIGIGAGLIVFGILVLQWVTQLIFAAHLTRDLEIVPQRKTVQMHVTGLTKTFSTGYIHSMIAITLALCAVCTLAYTSPATFRTLPAPFEPLAAYSGIGALFFAATAIMWICMAAKRRRMVA
jgi:hypothetical protein